LDCGSLTEVVNGHKANSAGTSREVWASVDLLYGHKHADVVPVSCRVNGRVFFADDLSLCDWIDSNVHGSAFTLHV